MIAQWVDLELGDVSELRLPDVEPPYSASQALIEGGRSRFVTWLPSGPVRKSQTRQWDFGIFTSTGASEAQVQALVQNPQYSLSVLTALAQGVQRLKDVPGRDAVVTFAAAVRTQDETRFLAAAMNMLARHHESVAPIAEVSAPGPIVGRTTAGALLIPLPVDYVAWTQVVARHAEQPGLNSPDRALSISGQVSPRAQEEFTARHWKLYEAFSIAAER